jgi:phosphoribosylaminoimidazolecarboxamide formyltransferase/IMP cyclohydrolase
MCSFGDFAAVSDVVDEATARILLREVSDGIIARGFEPKALEILSTKKGGAFVLLAVPDGAPLPPSDEYREIFGVGFHQRRNNAVIDAACLDNVVSQSKHLPSEAVRDLIVASITIKYTQSNSVGYAKNGMMIGVGAGQQSRVDCVKLAGRKACMWALRQHPQVLDLKFKPGVKRSDKVNARVRYLEGDITAAERPSWEANFVTVPTMLSSEEKDAYIATLDGVSISSDAFFPFRDSIDHASKIGVQYLAEPGGSNGDASVIEACDQYGMTLAFTGIRLFHH